MAISFVNAGFFALAAVALLGSPGPGIAALIAVGRDQGLIRGLRFYGGLQVGLAAAAAVSAAGLFSAIQSIPFAATAMTTLGTAYLLYLAFRIATANVSSRHDGSATGLASTAIGGFLLGITNPKAYLAFISLMASYNLIGGNTSADVLLKWAMCVIVMMVVDIAWLWLGVAIRGVCLSPTAQRIFNATMGALIAVAALLAFI